MGSRRTARRLWGTAHGSTRCAEPLPLGRSGPFTRRQTGLPGGGDMSVPGRTRPRALSAPGSGSPHQRGPHTVLHTTHTRTRIHLHTLLLHPVIHTHTLLHTVHTCTRTSVHTPPTPPVHAHTRAHTLASPTPAPPPAQTVCSWEADETRTGSKDSLTREASCDSLGVPGTIDF